MCKFIYEHVLSHLNRCIMYILHHYIGWSGRVMTIAQRKESMDGDVHLFILVCFWWSLRRGRWIRTDLPL